MAFSSCRDGNLDSRCLLIYRVSYDCDTYCIKKRGIFFYLFFFFDRGG